METKLHVNRDLAEKQINSWLDFKKVPPRKRENEDIATLIETLTDSIEDGKLAVNEDMSLTIKLDFPVLDEDGNPRLVEVTVKPRLTVHEINRELRKQKTKTTEDKVAIYSSVLTGEPKGMIEKLDTSDYGLLGAIVVFFL